ncbi:MAG: prefoldin subunit alpha [Promethearchaeota archaeon]
MTEEQQKRLERLYTEQKLTESNIALMQQRLDTLQVYLTNYRAGLSVLEEIENKADGDEMLINVGGSIFVEATLKNPKRVTRGLGSSIRIEQDVETAKKVVSETVESLGQQYEKLAQDYQNLVQRAAVLNAQFQQLASQIQESQTPSKEE